MRGQLNWLADEEKTLLCDEAFGLLESVGMKMAGAETMIVLNDAGAEVDFQTGIVRMSRDFVSRALKQCPRQVVLAGATSDKDVVLDGSVHFCNSGTASHALDYLSGQHRASTSEDLRKAIIVADATPEIEFVWSTVVSNDVPAERRKAVEWPLLVSETDKPVKLSFDGLGTSPAGPARRLMEILSGDITTFRKRPRVSFVCCTASPLEVNGRVLDQSVELSGYGAPIIVYPMPIAGATAPVTLASAITLNLAEFMAVAAALQVTHPGSPLIMGCGASILDMRATTYSFGALEGGLMSAALTELGHHLGVPVSCPGMGTDAKYPGIQAGFEKAMKGLVTAASGADLITGGMGLLNSANTLYLPQIVIDAEIAAMIGRVLSDVEMSHETIMSEAIERVGIGGHFLAERQTRLRVRNGEHFIPLIATRLPYETWTAAGRNEDAVARSRVDEILAHADNRQPHLTEDQMLALRTELFIK